MPTKQNLILTSRIKINAAIHSNPYHQSSLKKMEIFDSQSKEVKAMQIPQISPIHRPLKTTITN